MILPYAWIRYINSIISIPKAYFKIKPHGYSTAPQNIFQIFRDNHPLDQNTNLAHFLFHLHSGFSSASQHNTCTFLLINHDLANFQNALPMFLFSMSENQCLPYLAAKCAVYISSYFAITLWWIPLWTTPKYWAWLGVINHAGPPDSILPTIKRTHDRSVHRRRFHPLLIGQYRPTNWQRRLPRAF